MPPAYLRPRAPRPRVNQRVYHSSSSPCILVNAHTLGREAAAWAAARSRHRRAPRRHSALPVLAAGGGENQPRYDRA